MNPVKPPSIEELTEGLLGRLQGVKNIRPGQYLALCPSHEDRTPSLKISKAHDRLLIKCWAGCQACEILKTIGLGFSDLFVPKSAGTYQRKTGAKRQPAPKPHFYWNWRAQLAELENVVEAARVNAESVIESTHGLNLCVLANRDFDLVMDLVGRAYSQLERCGRLDETIFFLQQTLRAEERDAQ